MFNKIFSEANDGYQKMHFFKIEKIIRLSFNLFTTVQI